MSSFLGIVVVTMLTDADLSPLGYLIAIAFGLAAIWFAVALFRQRGSSTEEE
ncbi:MAG: hypothetical protein AB7R55_18935 [Gemmatimonadales bacterium]